MRFVIRMLRIGWRVRAKRDWVSFPNEWAILRPSANGIIWKHSLEKKVRVGLRFGARLALPSPLISVWELVANAPQVRAAAAVTCSLLQLKSVGTNPDETWAERQMLRHG